MPRRMRILFWQRHLTTFLFLIAESFALSDEKRLIKKLLEDYETVGKVGRPVYNTSQKIVVNYGLALVQILDLDEKNQVLTTNVWGRYVSTFYYICVIVFHGICLRTNYMYSRTS